MSTNLKRYIVIFPLVFTLILSCVPLLGAHAELLDKSFVDEIDTNYDSILKEPFDFSSLIPGKLDKTFASSIVLDNLTGSSYTTYKNLLDNSPYYYYSIFADSSLDSVLSHEASYCYVYCVFSVFSDNSLIEDTSSYYHYSSCGFASYCYYRFDGSTLSPPSSTRNDSDGNFYYSKDLGIPYRFKSNNSDRFSLEKDYYVIYQETNLPDFEYSDGSGHPDSGKLNVTVEIDPPLTGRVDPNINFSGDNFGSNNFFQLRVTNNSSSSYAHYAFFIVEPGSNLTLSFNDNPFPSSLPSHIRYVELKEEYSFVPTNSSTVTTAKGKSIWHTRDPGAQKSDFIVWSQMNLERNVDYDVVVLAYSSEYGPIECATPDYVKGKIKEVYRSTFSLSHATVYDPSNDSFGGFSYLPGDSLSSSSYSEYFDPDGQLQKGSFTLDDIRNNNNIGSFINNSVSNGGTFSNFNSLSYSISGFLSFFNGVWSYMPGNFTSLIGLSITALVVVAIFKGVFR